MKTTRILMKFLITAAMFTIAVIAFMEIGSKYYKCPAGGSPRRRLVCDPIYPVDQNKAQSLQAIMELKQQGIEPSRQDLDEAIYLAKYEEMGGMNGTVCPMDMIFVRDNLGGEGKYFVARHELEHVFIRNGMNQDCKKEEYCATMSAARSYPVGFIETILSSLSISAKESPTVWCFLFGSWSIFREYILGW
jgi:hypothetical protein